MFKEGKFDTKMSPITIILSALLTIILSVLLTGVVVWALWPVVIPYILPGLVKAGYVAASIPYVTSVWLSLLVLTILPSSKRN